MSDKEIVVAAMSKLNVTGVLESFLESLLDWRLSKDMTRRLSSSCPDQMVKFVARPGSRSNDAINQEVVFKWMLPDKSRIKGKDQRIAI
jgi:hypothetical protein